MGKGKTAKQRFDGFISEATALCFDEIAKELRRKKWKHAFLDARGDDEQWFGKFRAELARGKLISVEVPGEAIFLIDDAWQIKNKVFKMKWYGVVWPELTLYPDGTSKVEFDQDPHCLENELFFET